jgi:hypothetical protein
VIISRTIFSIGWADAATVDFGQTPPRPTSTPPEIIQAILEIEKQPVPDV